MNIQIHAGGRVVCHANLTLPLSARQAWGQIRDFHQYGAHDHFHAGFSIVGGVPKAGATLNIEHRYGPFRLLRAGKITRWKEGSGFAFSDLSITKPLGRFPHVFSMRIRDDGPFRCMLHIRVTGKWTAATPHWITWLWLAWVFVPAVQRSRNRLLAFAIAMQSDSPSTEQTRAGR